MKDLETRRKLAHLLLGIFLAALIFYSRVDKIVLGAFTLAAFIIFSICRYKKIEFMEWILLKFERPHARKTFPGRGALFFLLGSELSLVFFGKEIAAASVLILAIGDSIPKLIEVHMNNIDGKKSLLSSSVGILLSFLAASLLIPWFEALLASFFAVLLERFDMRIGGRKIDDNLVVPLSAGIIIWLIRRFF